MTPRWSRLMELLLLTVLACAILWKGGKSLEATWILVGVAGVMTFASWQRSSKFQVPSVALPIWLWAPLVLFVLWTGVTYLFSQTRNYGLDEVLRDGALVLVFLWMYRKAGAEKSQTIDEFPNYQLSIIHYQFVRVITFVTILACVIGTAVYVLQPVDRFVGTFFDFRFHTDYWPNAWAEYLLLAWPLVLLWVTRHTSFDRFSFLVSRSTLLGFVLGCLFLSYSRGAMMAFVGQVALLVLFASPWIRNWWRRGVLAMGIAIAVALLTFAGVNLLRSQFFSVQSVGEKIRFASAEGTSSIDERAQFWDQAWTLSRERPLLGYGPYSFRFAQPRFQRDVLATSDHPHNVFLKLLVERGWIGMLLFLWIVAYALFHSLIPFTRLLVTGFWFRKPDTSNQKPETRNQKLVHAQILVLIAVLGVLAHNVIDYNLQFVGIALPFWILLGLLAGFSVGKFRGVLIPVMRITEVLLAGTLMIITATEGRFLVLSSLGRHSEVAGRVDEALAWYDRAGGEWFSRDMHLSRAQLLIKEERYSEAMIALDTYENENAIDGRSALLRGRILLDQGKATEALESFEHAFERIGWNDLGTLGNILNSLRALGDRRLLGEWRPVFRERLASFGEAILRNIHFAALSHNVEEYESTTATLEKIFPGDVPADVRRRVLDHALEERARFSERPPGFLW